MKSPTYRRQRTFKVNGQKITIVTTRRTQCANFAGWTVKINGKKYRSNWLERERAEDDCFKFWLDENPDLLDTE